MNLKQRLAPWRERWQALAPRERRFLTVGVTGVLITVFYLAIWEPLRESAERRHNGLEQARALAVRLEQIAAEVGASQRGGGAQPDRSLSLLAAVDQSVKRSALGKPPSRLQPDGEKQIKVWLEDVSFDALVPWLQELETRYGILVQSVDIERESAAGLVNAQLGLARP